MAYLLTSRCMIKDIKKPCNLFAFYHYFWTTLLYFMSDVAVCIPQRLIIINIERRDRFGKVRGKLDAFSGLQHCLTTSFYSFQPRRHIIQL